MNTKILYIGCSLINMNRSFLWCSRVFYLLISFSVHAIMTYFLALSDIFSADYLFLDRTNLSTGFRVFLMSDGSDETSFSLNLDLKESFNDNYINGDEKAITSVNSEYEASKINIGTPVAKRSESIFESIGTETSKLLPKNVVIPENFDKKIIYVADGQNNQSDEEIEYTKILSAWIEDRLDFSNVVYGSGGECLVHVVLNKKGDIRLVDMYSGSGSEFVDDMIINIIQSNTPAPPIYNEHLYTMGNDSTDLHFIVPIYFFPKR